MYQELNEKIKQAQQGIARLHKINSMLENLEMEQKALLDKTNVLKEIAEKERFDVEKLENTSVASVFYSILGSLDTHIDEERKEALAAKLKYDQAVRDLEDVRYQISELVSERTAYDNCQNEYDRLYVLKKGEMLKESGEIAQELLEFTERLNLSEINLKEIEEALDKGRQVQSSLERVLNSLNRAEGWGTWDLFGGGLLTDLAKHSNIDDAKSEIENTQKKLRQFKTELVDVNISSDVTIEIDDFAKFADFFFDGLIADWFMQSKINSSQESINTVRSQVSEIVESLEHLKKQETHTVDKLKSEIDALVIRS